MKRTPDRSSPGWGFKCRGVWSIRVSFKIRENGAKQRRQIYISEKKDR